MHRGRGITVGRSPGALRRPFAPRLPRVPARPVRRSASRRLLAPASARRRLSRPPRRQDLLLAPRLLRFFLLPPRHPRWLALPLRLARSRSRRGPLWAARCPASRRLPPIPSVTPTAFLRRSAPSRSHQPRPRRFASPPLPRPRRPPPRLPSAFRRHSARNRPSPFRRMPRLSRPTPPPRRSRPDLRPPIALPPSQHPPCFRLARLASRWPRGAPSPTRRPSRASPPPRRRSRAAARAPSTPPSCPVPLSLRSI